jgi:hypothetical protein
MATVRCLMSCVLPVGSMLLYQLIQGEWACVLVGCFDVAWPEAGDYVMTSVPSPGWAGNCATVDSSLRWG